ncbi:MAG: RNA polymerase sigma factor [Bacteroidales bacterium]|nr:RNA polymerase sigma factor [Bacteroidales bacterium]MCF8387255.1 RNA polymerase sigma factor [Bacteroidales bacterium]MCF8399548.1 RNA polymerase sigma factor [Bacteroidales bacterium]
MIFNKASEKLLLKGLKEGNNASLHYFYKKYYPRVEAFVLSNKGTVEDSRDIFQESLYRMYLKVKEDQLKLEKSLEAYIFTVSKYLWFNQLRNTKGVLLDISDIENHLSDSKPDIKLEMNNLKKLDLYIDCFKKLDRKCRQLLEMSLGNYSHKEIVGELKISGEGYARKKKNKCIKKLIKLAEKDKRFKAIIDEQAGN